jgi:tRNA pseudouridine55 synthase
MATGVLLLAIGEGTKLVPYLTSDDKAYEAEICLGVETDTLDAEGKVTERAEVPTGLDRATVEAAIAEGFLGTRMQRAPIYSAIKQGGESLHKKVRRGEAVEAPERQVIAHRIELLGADLQASPPTLRLSLEVGKGYYVRSFARDLARAIGTRGHLSMLRRTRSGAFGVEEALDGELLGAAFERTPEGEASGGEELSEEERGAAKERATRAAVEALLALPEACRGLPRLRLSPAGEEDAGYGRPIPLAEASEAEGVEEGLAVALLGGDGRLMAIGRREEDQIRVARGFNSP